MTGTRLKKDSSWKDVAPTEPDPYLAPPDEGSIPSHEAEVLMSLLRPMTRSPDRCYFAIWSGYGGIEALWPGAARLEIPYRTYILLGGTLDDATQSLEPPPREQRANLLWPEDHSWFVTTEIDHRWTYVGGSAALIHDITTEARLEVFPTDPYDSVPQAIE
jgi:hypothetical protein